ncbi:transposase [Phocaeicola vulgatus]|nr:transposase [Phocaeicola vulgatus]
MEVQTVESKISVLNIDETWIKVRIKMLNDGTKLGHYYKKYVWALVNKLENITYFFYDNDENDSRGSRPIETFLGSFLGSIQSDGYVVYKHLAEVNPTCEFILCWAHVRNKFAMTFESNKDANAEWFVLKIGELYKIEAECILKRLKSHEIKKRRCQDDVTHILNDIYRRAVKLLNSKRKHYGEMMRKSLSYMINGWEELQNYRKDGRYTIDNMLVERAIRPFTVHRKNSLFFSSEEGVETALAFFTLIETCKNVGLNARDYIATTIKLLMDGNKNYDDLVPMSMAV